MLKDSILKNAPACGDTDGLPENEKAVVFTARHANGWKWTCYEAERVEMDDISLLWSCGRFRVGTRVFYT